MLFFPQIHGSEDKHINNAFEVTGKTPPLALINIYHKFHLPFMGKVID
jgi:hypothetical protein